MAFRPEEIELSSEGIPAKIRLSQFFNAKRKIAFCDLGDGLEVELMVPREAEGEIFFLPLRPQFFPMNEQNN
jgi:hypothetical protein